VAVESAVRTRKTSRLRRAVSAVLHDSLYRNSSFLILNSLVVTALGLLFWTFAARSFSASAVGNTTTVISGVAYAGMMGSLGLPNTIIRFLAGQPDRTRMLTTTGLVSFAAGAVVGLVWCVVPGHLGFPLSSVTPRWATTPIVVAVVASVSFAAVVESAIIALRRSKWVVVENGSASVVKLVGMPLAVGFGASGLFGLYVASVLASVLCSLAIIVHLLGGPRRRWLQRPDFAAIKHVRTFAAGNSIASLVSMLPGTVVRIVVLARLGARDVAYFAMPLMIVGLLTVIPSTASQSLFAEVAADEGSLGRHTRRALRGIYALLVPCILLLVVLARPLLSLFGSDYADAGTRCLQLLALSGIFAGFNYVADTVLNARRRVTAYVFVNFVGATLATLLPVAFVGHGLTGVGFGWLLGQVGYCAVAMAALGWSRTERGRRGRGGATVTASATG
jgi:O-antigen/teichoic acid export membrane protein